MLNEPRNFRSMIWMMTRYLSPCLSTARTLATMGVICGNFCVRRRKNKNQENIRRAKSAQSWDFRPDPLNLSDVDCRHRNGVSHLKRNFHFCPLGCCLAIRGAYHDSFRNDASVHCHGDIIVVRFSHMSSKDPSSLRTLGSIRTVNPSVPDARAILGESILRHLLILFGNHLLIQYSFRSDPVAFAYGGGRSCQLVRGRGASLLIQILVRNPEFVSPPPLEFPFARFRQPARNRHVHPCFDADN